MAKWYRRLSRVWRAIHCGTFGDGDVAPFASVALKTDDYYQS